MRPDSIRLLQPFPRRRRLQLQPLLMPRASSRCSLSPKWITRASRRRPSPLSRRGKISFLGFPPFFPPPALSPPTTFSPLPTPTPPIAFIFLSPLIIRVPLFP